MDMKANLEQDLLKVDYIIQKCMNDKYAIDLYGALCNNRFFKDDKEWTCSWRTAGGIVADIRNKGEDYTDFYCSGNEGHVTSEITHDLLNLGWDIRPYDENI